MKKERSTTTKKRILQVSHELFSTRGYDKTPISLILEKAEISKGGFYHYFTSKEEIIDLLARARVDAVVEIIDEIANDPNKPAIEKFNLLIERVQLFRTQNREQLYKLYEGYLKPENLHLKNKIDTYTLDKALPPYVKIVKQGIAEGVFDTSSPEFAVEAIIRIAPVLRMKMAKLYIGKSKNDRYKTEIAQIADYLEEFVLKILGAKEGSLKISELFKSYFFTD